MAIPRAILVLSMVLPIACARTPDEPLGAHDTASADANDATEDRDTTSDADGSASSCGQLVGATTPCPAGCRRVTAGALGGVSWCTDPAHVCVRDDSADTLIVECRVHVATARVFQFSDGHAPDVKRDEGWAACTPANRASIAAASSCADAALGDADESCSDAATGTSACTLSANGSFAMEGTDGGTSSATARVHIYYPLGVAPSAPYVVAVPRRCAIEGLAYRIGRLNGSGVAAAIAIEGHDEARREQFISEGVLSFARTLTAKVRLNFAPLSDDVVKPGTATLELLPSGPPPSPRLIRVGSEPLSLDEPIVLTPSSPIDPERIVARVEGVAIPTFNRVGFSGAIEIRPVLSWPRGKIVLLDVTAVRDVIGRPVDLTGGSVAVRNTTGTVVDRTLNTTPPKGAWSGGSFDGAWRFNPPFASPITPSGVLALGDPGPAKNVRLRFASGCPSVGVTLVSADGRVTRAGDSSCVGSEMLLTAPGPGALWLSVWGEQNQCPQWLFASPPSFALDSFAFE